MENTSFTWENKVVAITGGSRGIGKAIGLEAQSRGAKISVCDINENDLNNVSNEYGFLINNCDVGKESEITKFISETEQNLGDIDIFFAIFLAIKTISPIVWLSSSFTSLMILN